MSKNKTRPWFNWKQVLRLPAAEFALYLCGRRPQAALRSLFSQSGVLTGDRVITRIFTATKHSGLQGTLSRARPWASRTHTPLPRPLDAHACVYTILYNKNSLRISVKALWCLLCIVLSRMFRQSYSSFAFYWFVYWQNVLKNRTLLWIRLL